MAPHRAPKSWLKLWPEILWDPKFKDFTPEDRWHWVALLCVGLLENRDGIIDKGIVDLAYVVRATDADLEASIEKFVAAKMITRTATGFRITNWRKRQEWDPTQKPSASPSRVAERVRNHRAKKAVTRESKDVTPDVTPHPEIDITKVSDLTSTSGCVTPEGEEEGDVEEAKTKTQRRTPLFISLDQSIEEFASEISGRVTNKSERTKLLASFFERLPSSSRASWTDANTIALVAALIGTTTPKKWSGDRWRGWQNDVRREVESAQRGGEPEDSDVEVVLDEGDRIVGVTSETWASVGGVQ